TAWRTWPRAACYDRKLDTSTARETGGSINRRQRDGKVDAVKHQIAVLDHRRCGGPISVAFAAQQLGADRGAAENENFPQARDRGECPNVPPPVRPVGGRENLDDQNRVSDVVFFGFIPR